MSGEYAQVKRVANPFGWTIDPRNGVFLLRGRWLFGDGVLVRWEDQTPGIVADLKPSGSECLFALPQDQGARRQERAPRARGDGYTGRGAQTLDVVLLVFDGEKLSNMTDAKADDLLEPSVRSWASWPAVPGRGGWCPLPLSRGHQGPDSLFPPRPPTPYKTQQHHTYGTGTADLQVGQRREAQEGSAGAAAQRSRSSSAAEQRSRAGAEEEQSRGGGGAEACLPRITARLTWSHGLVA